MTVDCKAIMEHLLRHYIKNTLDGPLISKGNYNEFASLLIGGTMLPIT